MFYIKYLSSLHKIQCMFQKKFRKIVYLLFVLIISQFKSQAYSLDELENITEKYRAEGKIQELIDFNKKALSQYQQQNNEEGAVAAYINIANYLAVVNNYQESLVFLNKAEKDISEIRNAELKSKFYGAYARNYSELALYEQSLQNFNKSLEYAWEISDTQKRKKRLYLCYSWKMVCFEALKMPDSMRSMERKILSISPEPLIYVTIANRNLQEKKPDSTLYYLDKAMAIVDQYSVYEKGKILLSYGRLYSEKKEYNKALDYYMQSLDIFEKMKSKSDKRTAYKQISETYISLKNDHKANEYLKKYTQINDSITNEEKEVMHIQVEKVIHEKDQHEKTEKSKLYLLILLIIIGFIIVGYFISKVYLKKQKQKDEVIIEKSLETNLLRKKLNPVFEETIQLAKKGNPLFLTRFKEVYPDFYEKISTQYPSLTSNELKFCALLKLNFSSKEIMDFENISLRTVETRKYRLRKKLQLPSDIDINKWMMEQ